jgi:hypothetical protein
MLFQLLLNVVAFLLKLALWILIAIVAIPMLIYGSFQRLFPLFVHDASVWFWISFGIVTLLAYYILWKPILWLIGCLGILSAGQ